MYKANKGVVVVVVVDRVRRDIYSLGAKIDVNVKPIFTNKKL